MVSLRRSRSEEHTSELQSRVDISYAVFCLKKIPHAVLARRVDGAARRADTAGIRRPLLSLSPNADRRVVRARAARPLWRSLFFNDTATTEIYTLSLHDALPI